MLNFLKKYNILEKFIINEKGFLLKNILVKEDMILASDEDYKTKEMFLEKINATKKGFLDTNYTIKISELTKIVPTESEFALQIFFTSNGKKEKTYLEFTNSQEYDEVKEFLLNKTSFTLKNEIKGSVMSWLKKGLYTLIAGIIFGVTYFMSKDIENGNSVAIGGGRRRGLKKLMLAVAESLGSFNVLILGIVVVVGLCFWTYKAYSNGKSKIDYYD